MCCEAVRTGAQTLMDGSVLSVGISLSLTLFQGDTLFHCNV